MINKTSVKILIADDETTLRKILFDELSEEGFDVSETGGGVRTLELLEKSEYDVLLLDLNMPGLDGMEVLKRIKAQEVPVEVIILTGHGTVPTAVEAMRLGAYHYLTKPFNTDELKAVIEKAYEKKRLLSENVILRTQIKRQSESQKIITGSPLMLEMLETVKRVALSDLPVVICGESGVGKELIARSIHDESERAERTFIPINCGAIPENMLESELFGHEKGAFTGAHTRKLGLLEIANYGSVFLDEIGEMPLQLQTKLLRVLETGSFFRVGGITQVRVDVRFISATNKDIKTEVDKGNFRSDLYYRISAVTLNMPPLRDRRDDIPLLIEHFTKRDINCKDKKFTKEALAILSGYSWPGNIRELQNVISRTLLLSKGEIIDRSDLPADLTAQNSKGTTKKLEDIEKEHILNVLKEAQGHRGNAAEVLGISPKTLYRKLKDYGIKA